MPTGHSLGLSRWICGVVLFPIAPLKRCHRYLQIVMMRTKAVARQRCFKQDTVLCSHGHCRRPRPARMQAPEACIDDRRHASAPPSSLNARTIPGSYQGGNMSDAHPTPPEAQAPHLMPFCFSWVVCVKDSSGLRMFSKTWAQAVEPLRMSFMSWVQRDLAIQKKPLHILAIPRQ